MSGYLEGVLVLLAVNVVFAYGGFLPLAADSSIWGWPASPRSAPMLRLI